MLLADDIVLVERTKEFRISRMIAEYMKCNFSKITRRNKRIIQINSHKMPQIACFRYLRLIIYHDSRIKENVTPVFKKTCIVACFSTIHSKA